MPSIFISHSSLDRNLAAEIKAWLAAEGFQNVFLDFDTDTGLGAGHDWARQLYEAVSSSQAMLIIVTENWANSRWCFAEAQQARALGKIIFPVVTVPESLRVLGPELQLTQAVIWSDDSKVGFVRQLREITDEIARGYRWDRLRPPWPGILALDLSDAAVFFGRDREIIDVAEKLEVKRSLGGAPMLFLVGASGSGKSSLMRAGLLPYLSRRPRDWVIAPPIKPGRSPTHALYDVLKALVPKEKASTQEPRDEAEAIVWFCEELARHQPQIALLIAIDQFEELFSVATSYERQHFIEILTTLFERTREPIILCVATIRSDRLGELLSAKEFNLDHETLTVSPMPRDRVRSVIEGPARIGGLTLENGLVERILGDAAVPGHFLPLLAFALRSMYDRRSSSHGLTLADYEALGDPSQKLRPLENVVRQTAELALSATQPDESEMSALKEAFVGFLVRIDDAGIVASRPAQQERLPIGSRRLVDAFMQARLLTLRGEGPERSVEIAHEALLRVWPLLSNWVDMEKDFLLGRRQLEQAAQLWTSSSLADRSDFLLSGVQLARAIEWQTQYPARFTSIDDFVEASRRQDLRRRQRRRLLMQSAFAAIVIVAVALATLAIWASTERNKAELAANAAAKQRDKALETRSLLLARLGKQQNDQSDFGTGLSLAISALTDPDKGTILNSPDAELVLRNSLWSLREAKLLPIGKGIEVTRVSFSPDGTRLLSGSSDGAVRLFDVSTGRLIKTMVGHSGSISAQVFSLDGSLIATGDSTGGMRLWNGANGELVRPLNSHDQRVTSLEFSADAHLLLSASWDWSARITDIKGIDRDLRLSGHTNHVWNADFSHDEKTVVTAAEDGIRYFSASDGHLLLYVQDRNGVLSAHYSPSATTVLTTDRSGKIDMWRAGTSQLLFELTQASACEDCVAFSKDGNLAAVGTKGGVTIFNASNGVVVARTGTNDTSSALHLRLSGDGSTIFSDGSQNSARLDRIRDGSNIEKFGGHSDYLNAVDVSSDNKTYATGSHDGTVRIWKQSPIAGSSYPTLERPSTWATYSPDGRLLAIGSMFVGDDYINEGQLNLYDTATKQISPLKPVHNDFIKIGRFSPDGTRLVTISQGDGVFHRDGSQVLQRPTIMLWDVPDRKLIARLEGHTDKITSVDFSPDSALLVTTSRDGTARLTEAKTGSPINVLSGHNGIVVQAMFSPDGNRIVTISQDRTARLSDRQGQLIAILSGHQEPLTAVAFSPDGSQIATGSADFTLRLWSAEDGKELRKLSGHGGAILSVAFPQNDRIVSASADGTVRLWNADATVLMISDRRSYNGGQAATSADGTLISTSWGDHEVRIFDTVTAKELASLTTLLAEQFQKFVPGSHLLMVTSNYGSQLWRVPEGALVGEINLPFALGQQIYMSPAGDRFAVADEGGLRDMNIWPTIESLVSSAHRHAIRDLTSDDRFNRFFQ